MELFVLLLIIFLWILWGRVSALKRDYNERVENLEFTVQLLKDRTNSLQKQIGKATPTKKAEEKPGSVKSEAARTQEKPAEEKAKPEFKLEPESSPAVEKSVTPEEIPTDSPLTAPDFSEISFKDKPVEKAETSTPQPEGYDWLKKAARKDSEEPVEIKEPKPQKEKSAEKAESVGTTGVRVEKVQSLDEQPEDSEQPQPATKPASGKTPPPPPPPRTPDWQDAWQNFVANVDWEQFAGTKLFAWLGGIALFIGAGFFVKYSIDKNLISPIMRLVIGAIIGLGMIGGAFFFERGRFDIMRQTFSAGGIGVLYSVFFAATLYYEYLPNPVGFSCLVIVSATAFVLAIFHRGVSISALGAIGAYLTPLLVNTGSGNVMTLYLYLAIVNAGLYQVIRRLQSNWLLLLSTAGTMVSLAIACLFSTPEPEAMHIAIAWSAHVIFFSVLLDHYKPDYRTSRSAAWTLNLTYVAMVGAIFILSLIRKSSAPMLIASVASVSAIWLAFRREEIHRRVVPFSVLTFLAVGFWAFMRFTPQIDNWAFLLFFVYGLAGGAGPVLLVYRHGISEEYLKWFRVFPVCIALLGLMAIIINPNVSPLFWPMTIAIQLVGIAISLVFGAVFQLGVLTLILIIAALLFISGSSVVTFNLTFFAFIFLAGAAICLVTFIILRKIVDISARLNLDEETTAPLKQNPQLTEWMAASPVMGIFFVLAAAFWQAVPLNPHPGMVTMFCFLAVALTLTRKLKFENLAIVSLFSAAFAQGFWILRPGLTMPLYFSALGWSLVLFLLALALPFAFFRFFNQWRRLWMSWAIYELFQALFLVYAADHIWARDYSGWIPMLLAIGKIPIVAYLLQKLDGKSERNSIIACHGGVMLFYLSAVPILLLEKGWLGLVLVLESAALLWLNRRVEHPGLRYVSSVLAPVGLYLLLSFMPQMKGPDSIIILNPAVLSTLLAVLALGWAVKLADYPNDHLGSFNLVKYFEWLAFGAGFYLVNLVVADVFAGSKVTSGPTLRFDARGDLLQEIAYTTLWAAFGAILWSCRQLPTLLRAIGVALVGIATLWLIAFPFNHGLAVAAMAPVFNLGLLAYGPIILILLILFLREPWGDSYVSVKNLFLAMLLIAGFLCIKMVKATIFQPGLPLDLFRERTAQMAVASIAGWLIYGLLMLIWPKRLDKPFRIAGLILMVAAFWRAVVFPFKYSVDFGAMQPLLNRPTALYVFILALLVWLIWRKPDETWPSERVGARPFWSVTLALMAFAILNIEIASVFGASGAPFSLLTRGELAHKLGYSIGWLVYATIMLSAGIKWSEVRARQAALVIICITALKIVGKDLWDLGQLYRVASFIGLAVIMMLVSYLYQRFLVKTGEDQ